MEQLSTFVSGALAAGYLVVALFFGRFWHETHDRLFRLFALAFALLALQRVALSLLVHDTSLEPAAYAIRLLAFVVIIVAVVDKNRSTRGAA
jgi:hypothetical protein